MTKRLEEAIRRLTPQQLDRVADYAESLPELVENPSIPAPAPARMEWVGCLKNGPWHSGLEAQEAAKKLRIELLLRGMPK